MKLPLPERIPVSEICRGMGLPSHAEPDEATLALAEKAAALVLESAQPRMIWRQLPLAWDGDSPRIAAELPLEGRDIRLHLAGCDGCVLLAVTLGPGTDLLLRRLSAGGMDLAVAADAAASVLIEQCADEAERQIRDGLPPDRYMTGRYSPGYGDLTIQIQGRLVDAVNAQRQIGLAVTSNGILTPRKSITALLGVADHPVKGHLAGCASCALREICKYRKEGKTCAGN